MTIRLLYNAIFSSGTREGVNEYVTKSEPGDDFFLKNNVFI